MDLRSILSALSEHDPVLGGIPFEKVLLFCELSRWLRAEITAGQLSFVTTPPRTLPLPIQSFISDVLQLDIDAVQVLWLAMKTHLWDLLPMQAPSHELVIQFLREGIPNNITLYNLRPPTRTCLDRACFTGRPMTASEARFPRELVEPATHRATLFTQEYGPLPIQTTSLYCRCCKTTYYHNYYVHNGAATRTYYSAIPQFIQVATHYFVAADVCEEFTNMMVFAWTSATNCARVYNLSHNGKPHAHLLPKHWDIKLEIDTDHVWDAFFLWALVRDCDGRGNLLQLPNDASTQFDRLLPAIQDRNRAMVGPGQPQWNHACDLCCHITTDEENRPAAIRSVVTDGVSIGHPCCAVHDCTNPIRTKKGTRYCITHQAKEAECSVLSCNRIASEGFRTCPEPSHRALDDYLRLENKAMFQLRRRLELLHPGSKSTSFSPSAALSPSQLDSLVHDPPPPPPPPSDLEDEQPFDEALSGELESLLDNMSIECAAEKSTTGNKPHRAQFGRRRTHNEELAVASCGVILGRATFYGSEAINGVLTFWRKLFPTKASVPHVLWHDQNCRLWSVLQGADKETQAHFSHCALPVDVFHFKCKHKESDIVCGTHCNPYIWPELRTEKGEWRFNSSAAEQANVWLDKFQPIVRGMQVDRYNFFLDEAVKRRNEYIVEDLRRRGYSPYMIPYEALIDND